MNPEAEAEAEADFNLAFHFRAWFMHDLPQFPALLKYEYPVSARCE